MTTDVQQYLAPSRIGQGTAVEQSRAIAEVQAAIVVAQQCPRDVQAAIRALRDACRQKALAERAFFRYSRGGATVTGPSIHLARELARCWGNIQYGITEMRRDDGYGQSEMQAWAWDVQTNARSSNIFIVPHRRDTRDGSKALTDQRDIYENNANNGARRLREAVFAILPTWYVEDAKDACAKTLEDGGGKPLAERIAQCLDGFRGISVTQAQLEDKIGSPAGKWIEQDIAQLSVIYKSLQRGEVRKEEEFADVQPRVTAADVTAPQDVPPPADPPQAETPARASSGQLSMIGRTLKRLGVDNENRAGVLEKLAGRDLPADAPLTEAEGRHIRGLLDRCGDRGALVELLATGQLPEAEQAGDGDE
jgi:hypothetical protein